MNSQISIFLDPKGKMGIKTPYNAVFVDELKKNVPSASWSGSTWFFDPLSKDQVEKLLEKYYPPEDNLQLVRVTWKLTGSMLTIDGVYLVSFSRNSWYWRRDCPFSFKVIEADLKAYGRGITGTCTIEGYFREGAIFSPDPVEARILVEGNELNPLDKFTDKELARELIQRGYEIAKRDNESGT